MLTIAGLLLLLAGLLARLYALPLYTRFVASDDREARTRALLTVQSDKTHFRRIVTITYLAIVGGLALLMAGAIASV